MATFQIIYFLRNSERKSVTFEAPSFLKFDAAKSVEKSVKNNEGFEVPLKILFPILEADNTKLAQLSI